MRERPAKSADVMTFSLYLCLLAIGWSMLFSVGYNGGYEEGISNFLLKTQAGKQTIWVLISLIVFFFTQIIDRKFWQTFAYPIYGFAIVLLVLVLIFGKEIKGATSWFAFGGFSIQPSEFAKFATCLAVAAYISRINVNLKYTNAQLISFGLILVPAALILLQPDAGSALIFFSFVLLFFREGFPANFYIIGFSVAACFILGIMYEDAPLKVVWGIVALSLLGICSSFENRIYGIGGFLLLLVGSFFALGEEWNNLPYVLIFDVVAFLVLCFFAWRKGKGRTAGFMLVAGLIASGLVYLSAISFNFLARHQKDRINVWLNPEKCDPQGFILFFLILLWRITVIAERQRSAFVRCYAYGVVGILFVHFIVNIGMTMGLMPVIGIPLPFISKGGSSLLGFSLMIGVLLKMDRHRTET